MFCPECGVEYRPGFTHCSDCRIPLTAEKPRPHRPEPPAETELETVFETSDGALFEAAKRILEPSGMRFEASEPPPYRLLVPIDNAAEATGLLWELCADDLEAHTDAAPAPELHLVTIYEGHDQLELALIKELLNDNHIPFTAAGEEPVARYGPFGPFVHAWCRIQVAEDREAEARSLIQEIATRQA